VANNVEKTEKLGLHNLAPARGSHRDRKRIGRGPGSGKGKTSGKGHKGIKARSGHHGPGGGKPAFEGGQMPITRRLPKRGFTNPFREEAEVIRLVCDNLNTHAPASLYATFAPDEARRLAHGGRLAAATPAAAGPAAAYAPDGTLIALVTEEAGQARPLVVFA